MMSTKDGAVTSQIIKVIHDDCHEQVEHEEAAEEDKSDEEKVGDVAATGLSRLQKLAFFRYEKRFFFWHHYQTEVMTSELIAIKYQAFQLKFRS